MTSPRTPRQWNAGDEEPQGDVKLFHERHGFVERRRGGWLFVRMPDGTQYPEDVHGIAGWAWKSNRHWPLSEVLPETPEPPQAPTDRDLLHQNVRFAIADPGHFLPRKADEPVSHWSARAVMDVLGMLDMLGAPGQGYTVLASQSVPAVPVSSTGGEDGGGGSSGALRPIRDFIVQAVGFDAGEGMTFQAKELRDALLAEGWRPPLPEVMYDAGETAEEAVRRLAAEVVGLRQQLSSLPDSETEWGIRPVGQGEVEETGTEEWARAVAARLPTLYVAVSRRPAGPWIEVTS